MDCNNDNDTLTVQNFFKCAMRTLQVTDERRRNCEPKPSLDEAGSKIGACCGVISEEERCGWKETAALFHSIVTNDTLQMPTYEDGSMHCLIVRLCDGLLNYISEYQASHDTARSSAVVLEKVTALSKDRILFFLSVLCSSRRLALIGSEGEWKSIRAHVYELLIKQQHLRWMTAAFQVFCDESKRVSSEGTFIDPSVVHAVSETLQCLMNCCSENVECASALLYTEPRPLAVALLGGLRLRVGSECIICPQVHGGGAARNDVTEGSSIARKPFFSNNLSSLERNQRSLGDLSEDDLPIYLADCRSNVYNELNWKAVQAALVAVERTGEYESPTVVTALCLLVELSTRTVDGVGTDGEQVAPPLWLQVAMYENVITAWGGLCRLLHSTKGCGSRKHFIARCEAILQHQLKHDFAECLRKLLHNCPLLLQCEEALFRLVALQCTPPPFFDENAEVELLSMPSVFSADNCAPSYRGVCDNSFLTVAMADSIDESSASSSVRLSNSDTWWYSSEPFVELTRKLVDVLNSTLQDETTNPPLVICVADTLVHIIMNSGEAFAVLGGHSVVQSFMSILLSHTRFSNTNKKTSHSHTSREENVLTALSQRAVMAMLRAYRALGVHPQSDEVADIVELPLLMLKRIKAANPEENQDALKCLFALIAKLWHTVIVCSPDEASARRSEEIFTQVMKTLAGEGTTIICQQRMATQGSNGENVIVEAISSAVQSPEAHASKAKGCCLPSEGFCKGAGNIRGTDVVQQDDVLTTLCDILAALLRRNSQLLTARDLEVLLCLALSKDEALFGFGNACLSCSLGYRETYSAFAELINGAAPQQLPLLLSALGAQLITDKQPEGVKYERGVWLFQSKCVDAIITVLERVMRAASQVKCFHVLIRQVFQLLSVAEPMHCSGTELAETNLSKVFADNLVNIKSETHLLCVAQAVLDAAVCNCSSGDESHEAHVKGHLEMPASNNPVKKAFFMKLFPCLLNHMHEVSVRLEEETIAAVHVVLRATAGLRCETLLDWALKTKHASLVPYLELDLASACEKLPAVCDDDKEGMKNFWLRILSDAPKRSGIRFFSTGGISIAVGKWPTKGFSISSHFCFNDVYSRINLFHLLCLDEPLRSPICIFLSRGNSVNLEYGGKTVLINEPGSLKQLTPGKWACFHMVMSVAHTASVYFNATKIGACSLPYFPSGCGVIINVGSVNNIVPGSLFSIGTTRLWDEELTSPQVEAHVAGGGHGVNFCKILPWEVPREVSMSSAPPPAEDCFARFSPCELDGPHLLQNTLLCTMRERYTTTAKIVGNYLQSPRTQIDYRGFFANRGGNMYLLRWIGESKIASELELYTDLLCKNIRSITNASTTNHHIYVLLNFYLRRSAHLITPMVCDSLLRLTTAQVQVGGELHPFLINRLAFDHILRDVELIAAMPARSALYITERIERIFDVFACHFARRNARYAQPYRLLDSVFNRLVYTNVSLPFNVLHHVISCLKHVMIACDYEPNLVNAFLSTAALATPATAEVTDRQGGNVKLPQPRFSLIRISLTTSYSVSLLCLRALIECSRTSSTFMSVFSRLVDLNWFAACVSRFAESTCVVYATHLFLQALHENKELYSEVSQHTFAVANVLEPHCFSEDLLLVLLGYSVGVSDCVDLLHSSQSLQVQLQRALSAVTTEMDSVWTPVFTRLLMYNIDACLGRPHCFRPHGIMHVMERHLHRSYRLFKYFSLARVASRLMLPVYAARLNTTKSCTPLFLMVKGSSITQQEHANSIHQEPGVKSFRRRPSVVALRFALHIWCGLLRIRYARRLGKRRFMPDSAFPPKGMKAVAGTTFALKILHDVSKQSNGFSTMTRSMHQISLLSMFGSLLQRDVVMARSSELRSSVRSYAPEPLTQANRQYSNPPPPGRDEVAWEQFTGSGVASVQSSAQLKELCSLDSDENCDEVCVDEFEEEGKENLESRCCSPLTPKEEEGVSETRSPLESDASRGMNRNNKFPVYQQAAVPRSSTSCSGSPKSNDGRLRGSPCRVCARKGEDGNDADAFVERLLDDLSTLDLRGTSLAAIDLCSTVRLTDEGERRDLSEDNPLEGSIQLSGTVGTVVLPHVLTSASLKPLLDYTADILKEVIASSLHTAVNKSSHAAKQPYGACGYLLFQLILITGTVADTEEGAITLTHFFMHEVLDNVAVCGGSSASSDWQRSQIATNMSIPQTKGSVDSLGGCSAKAGTFLPPTVGGGSFDVERNSSQVCTILKVFICNVCAFNNLLLDFLSFHVIELSSIAPYFLRLLVYAAVTWHPDDLLELRTQVVKLCIAVLVGHSPRDVTTEHVELVYVLLGRVLSAPWSMKPLLGRLIGALFRVYLDESPTEVAEGSGRGRREVIALCFRLIAFAYEGSKDLKKALTTGSLATRISVYKGFMSSLCMGVEEAAVAAFNIYCNNNKSKVSALMSGNLHGKVALAFDNLLKRRTEYVNQMKLFSENYNLAMRLLRKYCELVQAYNGRFSSQVGPFERLHPAQLHWLFAPYDLLPQGNSHLRVSFYMDTRLNRSTIVTGSSFSAREVTANYSDARDDAGEDLTTILNTSSCEQQVNHITTLLEPSAFHCRPYICNECVSFVDPRCKVTPSALSLLQHLLDPGEVLRFISNGFRIHGIHVTPCLIVLTNVTVKVFSHSYITERGDVFLYADESRDTTKLGGDNDVGGEACPSSTAQGLQEDNRRREHRSAPSKGFAVSVTSKLQRFLIDGGSRGRRRREEKAHSDGTKVAHSVRQTTGRSCKCLYWVYPIRSISNVRLGLYMHQDTAIFLDLLYDEGPMLSLVDSRQSMNTRARDEFLDVLREVLGVQRCVINDHDKRLASLRSMLSGWINGSVSTLEYLCFLNNVAGRTLLDYNQYPIFPWVIADYQSEVLDLEADATYRDLSLPMGAQTKERRKSVRDLYNQMSEMMEQLKWEGSTGADATHPFHHGTHYSTSGGVLYYLIRMEPFTTYARIFQGGEFDVASRLFDTVEGSYLSCINGPADCKELPPQFYQDASFLVNANYCNFGVKPDGTVVNNVKLPPWAKGSTQVFTAVMRYLLESDRVAKNMHFWIDLIFGVCRRGPLAVERHNIFQRMTYGEEVVLALNDSETTHDINVIIAEVDNFGQTPIQLFQEHHPARSELCSPRSSLNDANFSVSVNNNLFTSVTSTFGNCKKNDLRGNSSFASSNGNGSVAFCDTASGSFAYPSWVGAQPPGGPREIAPKVLLMLEREDSGQQRKFVLDDHPPGGIIKLPLAITRLLNVLQDDPITGFSRTQSGVFACHYKNLIPVEDGNHFLCFSDACNVLMHFDITCGRLFSALRCTSVVEPSARISSVCVTCRETLVLVGSTAGTIYCLSPNVESGALMLNVTLHQHTNPIAGFAADSKCGRFVSFTTNEKDAPVVWCVHQQRIVMLHRIDVVNALGAFSVVATDSLVVSCVIDPLTANTIVATKHHLLIFDRSGERYGVGSLTIGAEVKACDGGAKSCSAPCVAAITLVATYNTLEWAGGTQLFLTGHEDGSICLWRAVQLPPHEVAHGSIVKVKHHAIIADGSRDASLGAVTAVQQQQVGVPVFLVGYHSGAVKVLGLAGRDGETKRNSK